MADNASRDEPIFSQSLFMEASDCGSLPETPMAERRILTILFADLVGFTAISESAGDETAFRLIHRVSSLIKSSISAEGGSVRCFTGDGAMALFGLPIPLHDGPLRACRGALLIHQHLADVARDFWAQYGILVQMRIGINTGPVIIGEVQSGDGLITAVLGDTVNVTARLQDHAAPGTILLSEAVHQQVGDLVESEFLGKHLLKGKGQPQSMYRLTAIRPRANEFETALGRGFLPLVV